MKNNQKFAGVLQDLRQIIIAYDNLLFISIYIEDLEDALKLIENDRELVTTAFLSHGKLINRVVELIIKEFDPLDGKGVTSVKCLKIIIETIKPRLYKAPDKLVDDFSRSLLFHIIREINDKPDGLVLIELNKGFTSSIVKRAALKVGYNIPAIKGYYRSEYNCVSKTLKTKDFTKVVLPDCIINRLKNDLPLGIAFAA